MADNISPPISTEELQQLQDGISASIQTVLKAYNACDDPVDCATLLNQSQQLAGQMSRIETALFHQQTIEASAAISGAFDSADGFIAELKQMTKSLDQASKIITAAAKLAGVVAQILAVL